MFCFRFYFILVLKLGLDIIIKQLGIFPLTFQLLTVLPNYKPFLELTLFAIAYKAPLTFVSYFR